MVLDEPRDADKIFQVNGFTMLVDRELHEQTRDLSVDYVDYAMGAGFRVTAEVPVGGKTCGGSCSC
jgi:Fe-S cluster assembly iron-binding protein IscA